MIYRLIDTNILYDYFGKTTFHTHAWSLIKGQRILILQEVLTELYNLLRKKGGVDFAVNKISELLKNTESYYIIAATAELYPPALHICKKLEGKYPNKDLSLVDALQLAYCQKHSNIELYTTEKRMGSQSLIPVIQPYSHKTA
jgi:predicted nucleic acid-binding protein